MTLPIAPAWTEVMTSKVDSTSLSHFEVFSVGHAVIDWIMTVQRLGHASPASTLDYTTGLGDMFSMIVRDFVAWTCGREDMVPGDPKERLYAWIETAGWEQYAVERLAIHLDGAA